MQQFLNDDNATRINISKHERSRDNTLENSSWSNYAPFPPLPHSKPPLNFIPIFFDSIFVVCSVRNENVLFARGDSTTFPDHVNYGNCRLLARANSPKSALLSTGFATRVISSETLFERGCPPSSRIVSRRVSTFLGLVSFCTVISSHCYISFNNYNYGDSKLVFSFKKKKVNNNRNYDRRVQ